MAMPETTAKYSCSVMQRIRERVGYHLWRLQKLMRSMWAKYAYASLRAPKTRGAIQHTEGMSERIRNQLREAGLTVVELEIDPRDYRHYREKANYERFAYYMDFMGAAVEEKALEHYVAARLLELRPGDRLIDVASCNSPAPQIYHDLFGCDVWSQDLDYPRGVHDHTIGGDAAAMPVDDGFADKMALHCSFEHFEGDADCRFVREASRVLRPGGRMCILPLYLHETYAIQTDPRWLPWRGIAFDAGAVVHAVDGWCNRHGRFYDVPHFLERVVRNLSGLRLTVFFITCEKEPSLSYQLKFAALFEKP